MKFLPLAAAVLIFPLALIAQSQPASALRHQHEKELTTATGNRAAIALNLTGRSDEALAQLQRAAKSDPASLNIKMQTAIVLDYLGRHDEAGQIYDDLFKQIQAWRSERMKALKAGDKTKSDGQDADVLGVSLEITANAALNNVFRGKPDQSLVQFTSIYESRSPVVGPDAFTDYAALWRLWLTAKIRADDGMRSTTALDVLADTLSVSTPYHEAMLKLWQGKGHWQKVLAAIDGMKISDAEKETFRTEAHFFAAGYFRYAKRDNDTALELLNAENARPFNGCVERIFIREEIAALKK